MSKAEVSGVAARAAAATDLLGRARTALSRPASRAADAARRLVGSRPSGSRRS